MSRDGLFFKKASEINAVGSPSFATHITLVLACLFLLVGKDINERLSDIATFFFVGSYLSGFAALIRLRIKEPNLHRPFRVWAYPYLPILLVFLSSLFLLGTLLTNQQSILYVLIFIGLSYGIYHQFLKKN